MSKPIATSQRLTQRELQVLTGIACGDTDEAIARRIHISHWTVKTHVASILVKLRARNRAHAVARGFVAGYLAVRPEEVMASC